MSEKPLGNAREITRYLIDIYGDEVNSLLEVGCGSADFLRSLAREKQVPSWGIDPFVPKQQEGRLTLLPLKAEELPALNRRFDLIYSLHALHHFQNIDAFFDGLAQVLSWRGRAILVDWKKGAQTGIPETYYRLTEIAAKARDHHLQILDSGQTEDNFYLVAMLQRRCLAVATDETGETIFPKMFGQAPYFDLYVYENNDFHFLERRRNIYQKTMQHEKTLDVYGEVPECQALLSRRIGRNGQVRLREKGVFLFFEQGSVLTALEKIAKLERSFLAKKPRFGE